MTSTNDGTSPALVLPVLADAAEPATNGVEPTITVLPADAATPADPPYPASPTATVGLPPGPMEPLVPADITFVVTERPAGTVGKKNSYNLRQTLGMTTPDYLFVMNRIQAIGEEQGFNWHAPPRNHAAPAVQRIVDEAQGVFPHFNDFSDCINPQWPIEAFIRVVFKRVAHLV
ncbi:hypothetical protein FRC09_004627 [Ceratobasidium sp. 395]|nr:hypothetical protein FRC09_004627 [Ceratobasidium sp. 395]